MIPLQKRRQVYGVRFNTIVKRPFHLYSLLTFEVIHVGLHLLLSFQGSLKLLALLLLGILKTPHVFLLSD